MDQRISIITLGVGDLDRAVAFYRDGLQLRLSKRSVPGVIAFFETSQTWLTLFQREALAEDAGVSPTAPGGFPGFALAHNVRSKEAADEVMAEALAAGATVTREMHDTGWGGYSGYFRDPDGFLWEVAWNPHFWIGDGAPDAGRIEAR